MNVALIKWALTRLLPGVLLFGAIVAAAGLVHHAGYQSGVDVQKLVGDNALVAEQKSRADERQQLAEAGRKALAEVREREQAQRARADGLAAQLAWRESELQQTKALLQQSIEGAVSDDNKNSGCGFTGLGPRGLQLYDQALGYAGGGDASAGGRAGQ